MVDVSLDAIEDASAVALRTHGAANWIAASVARAVRRAEETGNVICGLYYLESYCAQLRSGRVDGTVNPQVIPPSGMPDSRWGFPSGPISDSMW